METQKTTITINGIKVEVNEEIKRSWYKMINDTRNEARKNATCGQESYWRCGGDCAICPWQISGKIVSYEEAFMTNGPVHGVAYGEHLDADRMRGAANGEHLGPDPAPDPAEIAEQADTVERMLAHARRTCEDGDLILKMCMDQLSSYEIGRQLGIPQKTAYRRVKKLMTELREYYINNFG